MGALVRIDIAARLGRRVTDLLRAGRAHSLDARVPHVGDLVRVNVAARVGLASPVCLERAVALIAFGPTSFETIRFRNAVVYGITNVLMPQREMTTSDNYPGA